MTGAPPVRGRIGPFRVLASLGEGAMGEVFLAEDPASRAPVALKVFHSHVSARPGFEERFRREAEAGARVDDPHVVRTRSAEVLEVDGHPRCCLVMDYVDGKSLREVVRESAPLPESLVREIGRQAALGLAAIHAAGIVHRDVKPENLLLTKDQAVRLMDLGIAHVEREAHRITESGIFVGSVLYAAPEQFGDAPPDARADLYSLGLVLQELVTGRHPFEGPDVAAVIRQHLARRPCRAADLNPQVSPFLDDLIQTLLAKEPGERIASAADLAAVLERGEKSDWWRDREIRRPAGRRPRRRRKVWETALHGRRAELARLRHAWDRARAGEGAVVLVRGEAGIGKSRLVDEFFAGLEAAGEDFHFLAGGYPPGGGATPWGAFTTAFRNHLGAADPEPALRRYLHPVPGLVPGLAALLRMEPPPAGAAELTRDGQQSAVIHVTRALAGEKPTVLLVEDLHFAPEDGRGLFAALAHAVAGHRVLLVGTVRRESDERWLASVGRMSHCTRIDVDRLPPDDVRALLAEWLRSERLAEDLAPLVETRCDGNPFFVLEILRDLRERETLRQRADGSWEAACVLRDVDVPSSVHDLLRARIADLDDADRDLLEVAACCGHDFDPRVVAEAAGLDLISALRSLGRIERRLNLVHSVGDRFVFDHHQVQEILRASVAAPLREAYHASIADAIERRSGAAGRSPGDVDPSVCVDLARQYLAGGRPDLAWRYLPPALDFLERAYRNHAALSLIDAALASRGPPQGADRVRMLLRRAARLDLLGRWPEERRTLDEAVRLADAAGDASLAAVARVAASRNLFRLSLCDESRTAAERALELARSTGDAATEARAAVALGIVSWELGRNADAARWHSLALSIARRLGDDALAARALIHLGNVALASGTLDSAESNYERCIAVARGAGDRLTESDALVSLAAVLRQTGRFEDARAAVVRALEAAREIGARRAEAAACGALGALSQAVGRYEEARAHFVRRHSFATDFEDARGEALACAHLGRLALQLGAPDEARTRFARCLEIVHSIAFRRLEPVALAGLAAAAAEVGDAAGAEAKWVEAIRVGRESGHREGFAETLCAFGGFLADRGRHDEAAETLGEAASIARRLGRPDARLLSAVLLAALPGGEPADPGAVASAESRAGIAARMQARWTLWRATRAPEHLEEAGRLLDHVVEHAPPASRDAMLRNVALHREIAAARALRAS